MIEQSGIDGTSISDTVPAVVPESGLRRSTRVRTQTKDYVPIMNGTKYAFTVRQIQEHGVLHPDSHMFMQDDFYQAEPDVVAYVMTQLSLKVGLKTLGDKALSAVK